MEHGVWSNPEEFTSAITVGDNSRTTINYQLTKLECLKNTSKVIP